jgi:hypothetical protein
MEHNFDGTVKATVREENLKVAKCNAFLFDKVSNKLTGSWCELMGVSGKLTLKMLDGLLQPGGFVGVDRDPNILTPYRRGWPEHHWLAGDLKHLSSELQTLEIPINVLNIDGYHNVGSKEFEELAVAMKAVIQRGIEAFGQFLFISNNTLSTPYGTRNEQTFRRMLRGQVNQFVQLMGDYFPTRSLNPENLLSTEDEQRITLDFQGFLGAFQIYTGKGGQPMANMKVLL